MRELKVKSRKRNEMIDITSDIQEMINKENIQTGHVIAYVPHTTAGITINEGAESKSSRIIHHSACRKQKTSSGYMATYILL
jgi:secondary thiamine-phosphate synthase enzyme